MFGLVRSRLATQTFQRPNLCGSTTRPKHSQRQFTVIAPLKPTASLNFTTIYTVLRNPFRKIPLPLSLWRHLSMYTRAAIKQVLLAARSSLRARSIFTLLSPLSLIL